MTLGKPALLRRALAKTTIKKRYKLSKILFEIEICLASLPRDVINTDPHANGMTKKCKKLIGEGIFSAVRTRGNRAVPTPNKVRLELVIYPFCLDVDSNAVPIHQSILSDAENLIEIYLRTKTEYMNYSETA